MVEEMLSRELRQVADNVEVPAMPKLPAKPARVRPRLQPLLAAAVVLVFMAGALALLVGGRGPQQVQPAPEPTSTDAMLPQPTPRPTLPQSTTPVPRRAPDIPYVLDGMLYVGGEQVPGTWWHVYRGSAAWVAIRSDNTWWWGRGRHVEQISGLRDAPPVISPSGELVAATGSVDQGDVLMGFETQAEGKRLRTLSLDLGDQQDGTQVTVRAVTDDGMVIAQGARTSVLWLPYAGDGVTVDLTKTAPGQEFLASTPGGLVVADESEDRPYLARISEAGVLTPIAPLAAHDDLLVSRAGTWVAWTPPATTGGEVDSVPTLEVQSVDGSGRATLSAPESWAFRVRTWAWEDDEHLVSVVTREDGDNRLARCRAESALCVLVER